MVYVGTKAFIAQCLTNLPEAHEALTIIIPVYNEASNLETLIQGLAGRRLANRYRIIICDDASEDNSFALLQQLCAPHPTITCIRNRENERKVGAIKRMARLVRTPFVLTLDADCMITELQDDALEKLMRMMHDEGYAAACFRIIPNDRSWLGNLQKLDYAIFTDTLRRILRVPVCLIGQGILWNTDRFLDVLSSHSGRFEGDDLENTLIALTKNMRLYFERDSLALSTIPKPTIISLVRQRALSWDFGMFRVLLSKNTVMLGGDSGAFYKNILLMDLVAHPLRLLAIPLLLGSVGFFRLTGDGVFATELYRQSLTFSFRYGSAAIVGIWIASVVNSFFCTRQHIFSTLKWAVFNAIYLSSPFVFVMYYPLVAATHVNADDVFGSAVHWFELGLFLTYLWWAIVTLFLLLGSSLQRAVKVELLWSVILAPIYYLVLLVVCKTIGICKALKARVMFEQ